MKLEDLLVLLSHVSGAEQLQEVLFQSVEFTVLTLVEGQNGYPVLRLEKIRIGSVVDQDHFAKIPINYSQILDQQILVDFSAVPAVETMLDVFMIGVELVQNNVCVGLVTRCEGNDFVVLCHGLEESDGIGADGDEGLRDRAICRLDRQDCVELQDWVLLAVDQSLIYIQHQSRLPSVLCSLRQMNFCCLHFRKRWRLNALKISKDVE